jgi:hypothetical protein
MSKIPYRSSFGALQIAPKIHGSNNFLLIVY